MLLGQNANQNSQEPCTEQRKHKEKINHQKKNETGNIEMTDKPSVGLPVEISSLIFHNEVLRGSCALKCNTNIPHSRILTHIRADSQENDILKLVLLSK